LGSRLFRRKARSSEQVLVDMRQAFRQVLGNQPRPKAQRSLAVKPCGCRGSFESRHTLGQ